MGNSGKHKQVEDLLKRDEKICRAIAEAAQDAIYIINHEGEVEYINSSGAMLFGLQPEKVLGRQLEAIFPPYIAGHLKEKLGKVFETGLPIYVEDNIPFLKGKVWMNTSLAPIRNERGEVASVIGISRDITGRKRLEEELRLLQELMQDISMSNDFNSAMEIALRKICEDMGWVMGEVWVPSQDGSYLDCSPAWYGVSRELKKFRKASEGFKFKPGIGLPGSVWLLKKAAWETDITLDSNFLRAPYAVEAGLKAAMAIPVLSGDRVVAVLDFFVPEVREEDRRLIELVSTVAAYLGILFQRKKAEEALRESEERFRATFSQAAVGIAHVATDGRWLLVNQKLCDIVGYTHAELLERTFQDITFPDDLGADLEYVRQMLANEIQTYSLEKRYIRKDGSLVWINLTVSLVRNSSGRPQYFISIVEDISERKRLEAQLLHSQKLEAIGQLVGGIAHDFNNILTGVIGFAGLMQMRLKKDDPMMENVEQILEAAGRGASLTRSLLVFGRKQVIHLAPVNLNEIIGKVDKLLSRLIGEDIELRVATSKKDLMIMADSVQIEQILINLATNARDAMADGGVLTIETGHEKLDNEFIRIHGYGEAGDYALISVSDTGHGMDEKVIERVFEPFFTTKKTGKGTGLGLSIVYGIVKQHNGYINVYSEVGKGTTFRIYLPLIKIKAEEIKPEEPAVSVTGTETVLVGEDDAAVRKLSKTLLETFGYKVIEAADGEDAVEKFMENKGKIQLVILDVIMPKKNGKEAYAQIRKISPGVKVLFMSGYTADDTKKRGILEEGLDFVSKPISPSGFLRKVREVLDK